MRVPFVLASLFALVCAENFLVIVGKDGGLTYDPPSVTAKTGDTVAFRFVSKNHTVTQSSFAKPCEPLTTPTPGVDSGYAAVPANATAFPEWSFTVNDDTTPLWFYCAQARHCQAGMVFALNPTPDKTFETFKATAMGASPPASGSSSSGTGGGTGTPSSAPGNSSSTATASVPSGSAAGVLNPQENSALPTDSVSGVTVVITVVGLLAGSFM